MADKLQIKGGSGDVPRLDVRELGYSKDEKALYIGTESGNVKLCNAGDIIKVAENSGKIASLEAEIEALKAELEAFKNV